MQSDNCRCTEWKLAQSRNDNNNNNNEIARCSHAVIWGSWSVRAHPEINCDRIPVRAHAHARHPPIYPFSFLLVSPRAYFLAPLSTPLFLHTLNRLSSALSSYRGRGGGGRALVPSLVRYLLSRFAKRKNDKRSSRGHVRNQLEDQRGHRHLWPGIPLNGLSLASPFRNRSMELVSSPRLATFLSLYSCRSSLLLCFPFAPRFDTHFSFPPPPLLLPAGLSPSLHLTSLVSFFPFNDLCLHENFIIRRVTLTEA